jgi:hypothetical protein
LVLTKVAVRKRGAEAQGMVEGGLVSLGRRCFHQSMEAEHKPSFCQVSSSYLQEVEIAIARDKRGQHSKSKKQCATKDHTHGLCKVEVLIDIVFLFAVCMIG